MCRSMVDIHSVAAEIWRGKKIEGRKKLQGKNIMAPLLHRAAITSRLNLILCAFVTTLVVHFEQWVGCRVCASVCVHPINNF